MKPHPRPADSPGFGSATPRRPWPGGWPIRLVALALVGINAAAAWSTPPAPTATPASTAVTPAAAGLGASAVEVGGAPAGSSDDKAPQVVRIVCMAETQQTFFDEKQQDLSLMRELAGITNAIHGKGSLVAAVVGRILNAEIPPVGGWYFAPIGSGFVVDAARRYVVTNWHVVTACPMNKARGIQIGIVEPTGTVIQPILAEPKLRNADGKLISVKSICRNVAQPCAAKLPGETERRRITVEAAEAEGNNVDLYAPDVAVLELRQPARAQPLPLNPDFKPSTQKPMSIVGYPQVAMQLQQESTAIRRQMAIPLTTPASFSNDFNRDNTRPGLPLNEVVKANLLMLSAQVHAGNSGGPLMADGAVVGVVSATLPVGKLQRPVSAEVGPESAAAGRESLIPSGYALAVPVKSVVDMLDFLGIDRVRPEAKSITPVLPAPSPVPAPPPSKRIDEGSPAQPGGWSDPQKLIAAGLALSLLVAAGAFAVVARRSRQAALPLPSPVLDTEVVVDLPSPSVPPRIDPAPRASGAAAPVRLMASHGPLVGTFSLPTPNGSLSLIVGRDVKACQLVFPNQHDMVSALHCCFSWNPQSSTLTVRDMSTNGVFVNGRRIEKGPQEPLKNGDTIDLGGANLNRFTVDLA